MEYVTNELRDWFIVDMPNSVKTHGMEILELPNESLIKLRDVTAIKHFYIRTDYMFNNISGFSIMIPFVMKGHKEDVVFSVEVPGHMLIDQSRFEEFVELAEDATDSDSLKLIEKRRNRMLGIVRNEICTQELLGYLQERVRGAWEVYLTMSRGLKN